MPKLPRYVQPRQSLHIKLPTEIILAIAEIEERTGETRTGVVERLLKTALKSERNKTNKGIK